MAKKLGIELPAARKGGRPFVVVSNADLERIIEMDAMNYGHNGICRNVDYGDYIVRDLRKDPEYQAKVIAKRKAIEDWLATQRVYSNT